MPKTECKTIASYAEWSDYCRQSLLWLSLPDPAACIFEYINDDPDRELLGNFLQAWHNRFGKTATLVKEVVSAAQDYVNGKPFNEMLNETVTDFAGERDGIIDRRHLGCWIKRRAGRVVNGLRFVKDETTRNAAKWKFESVSSVFSPRFYQK
jgi:putative DNA primase/helicase